MKSAVWLLILVHFVSTLSSIEPLGGPKWCNIHNIFNGSWSYGDIIHVNSNPYASCPATLKTISKTTLRDQPAKWSCLNSSYYSASYSPFQCALRSINHSLKLLEGKHLVFIGDSLMGEIYISISCLAERMNLHDSLTFQFIHELFLRPDFPCDPQCITNSTFRRQQINSGLIHSCFQCPNGTKIYFNQSYVSNPKYWPQKVKTSKATSVLLSVGAWFNYYHLMYQPIAIYKQTLLRNVPIFHHFKRLGVLFYWLDVPPMPSCNEAWCKLFGWELFEQFNIIAREILEPAGVIFLNTSQATKERKDFDLNITDPFRLHWCNPGPDTVPELLNQFYLHLLTHHLGL
jgi:hypothetical protein